MGFLKAVAKRVGGHVGQVKNGAETLAHATVAAGKKTQQAQSFAKDTFVKGAKGAYTTSPKDVVSAGKTAAGKGVHAAGTGVGLVAKAHGAARDTVKHVAGKGAETAGGLIRAGRDGFTEADRGTKKEQPSAGYGANLGPI